MSNLPANQFQSAVPTVHELDSYKAIATIAASNQHWRKVGGGGSEASVVATILSVMLMARELGIPPIQSISGGINNIQGKFEISARTMNMLIRKHGHRLQIVESDNNICTLFAKRKDTGEERQETYHIEEARQAGLVKPGGGWSKNPADMLFARCISRLARRMFPDCIGGCYVEGELQETMLNRPFDQPIDIPDIEVKSTQEISQQISEIEFELPSDITRENLNVFIKESSEISGRPAGDLIAWANKNSSKFIDKIRAWEDAKSTPVLTPDPEQVYVET